MKYFGQAFTYLSKAILLGTLVFLLYYVCSICLKKRRTLAKNLIIYIFIDYLIAVLLVTRIISGYGWKFYIGSMNLIPFSEGFNLQHILNAVMFMPFGILMPAFIKKRKYFWTLCLASVFSLFIEMAQWLFVGRFADVDDIIMNVSGAALGCLCYRLFVWLVRDIWKIKIVFDRSVLNVLICLGVFFTSIPILAGRICIADGVICNTLGYQYAWIGSGSRIMDFTGIHITLLYLVFIVCFFCSFDEKEGEKAVLSRKLVSGLKNMVVIWLLLLFVRQYVQ